MNPSGYQKFLLTSKDSDASGDLALFHGQPYQHGHQSEHQVQGAYNHQPIAYDHQHLVCGQQGVDYNQTGNTYPTVSKVLVMARNTLQTPNSTYIPYGNQYPHMILSTLSAVHIMLLLGTRATYKASKGGPVGQVGAAARPSQLNPLAAKTATASTLRRRMRTRTPPTSPLPKKAHRPPHTTTSRTKRFLNKRGTEKEAADPAAPEATAATEQCQRKKERRPNVGIITSRHTRGVWCCTGCYFAEAPSEGKLCEKCRNKGAVQRANQKRKAEERAEEERIEALAPRVLEFGMRHHRRPGSSAQWLETAQCEKKRELDDGSEEQCTNLVWQQGTARCLTCLHNKVSQTMADLMTRRHSPRSIWCCTGCYCAAVPTRRLCDDCREKGVQKKFCRYAKKAGKSYFSSTKYSILEILV
ncbi:hypothetical protein B0T20DRAFT_392437 [Sordaria brevicollis]|uniref:Uncharacterized protein n=1 Tax=Sordaria brevicollis TaxID=83679 RepID=A0AAE0PG79_SORBR|nr:hypothetical protein B0T20DRAFT_392437 [Sordaria brevicollis]